MPNKRARRQNASYKAHYARGPLKTIKNKERKLLNHLEKHPNDKQATTKDVPNYKRKTPLTYWENLKTSPKATRSR